MEAKGRVGGVGVFALAVGIVALWFALDAGGDAAPPPNESTSHPSTPSPVAADASVATGAAADAHPVAADAPAEASQRSAGDPGRQPQERHSA